MHNPFENYSQVEKKNLALYMTGLVFFKFVLETMSACLSGIVLNRLSTNTGVIWANMQGLNLAFQALGSVAIGPLSKRVHSFQILRYSVAAFGIAVAVVPVLEFAYGGRIPASFGSKNRAFWANWSPFAIYPIYAAIGLFSGMVELLRRVIPTDVVGADVEKLKVFDGAVHVAWELVGTIGSLSAYIWIAYFGWSYALALLPVGFIISCSCWSMMTPRPESIKELKNFHLMNSDKSYFSKVTSGAYSLIYSVWYGGKLVLSHRSLIWLLPAYSLPLLLHKYLEGTIFPFWTKSKFSSSDYQTILNGGSNFGEMLGGLLVLLLARQVKTPIPFLRLDAILHFLVWVIPFFPVNRDAGPSSAWAIAPIMAVISLGWSAGDVALAAYVQGRLGHYDSSDPYTTPLGAVMSFLFVTYLIAYYILNLLMSKVRDNYVENSLNMTNLYVLICGVFMSCCAIVVFLSTFIPRGSFGLNPDLADDKMQEEFESQLNDGETIKVVAAL